MSGFSGYRDRADAGMRLAEALRRELPELDDAVVLALPRGGVPVAHEIARALRLPLDVMLVRKLGLPVQPELAMGAIASGGVRLLNDQVLSLARVSREALDAVEAEERAELERRQGLYRGLRPLPDLRGRTVILVDDGVATGFTLLAAIEAVRAQGPRRIVVAVPVASPEAVERLAGAADEVVCAATPAVFLAISEWYDHFPQVADQEVRALLEGAWEEERRGREAGEGPGTPEAASPSRAPSRDPSTGTGPGTVEGGG